MAIAFDSVSSGTGAGTAWSLSHTSSGNDRILLVFVSGAQQAAFLTGITCDGLAMTLARRSVAVSAISTSVWYIIGQKAGSNSIALTWSSDPGSSGGIIAQSYTGANDIDSTGASGGTSFGTETVSISTSFANSWIASALTVVGASGAGITTPTGYSVKVAGFDTLGGNTFESVDSNGSTSSGSHSIVWNWTSGGFNSGATVAIGIKEGSQPTNDNCIFFAGD